jgi:hypothetical protein
METAAEKRTIDEKAGSKKSLSFLKAGEEAVKRKDGTEFDWDAAAAFTRDQLSEAMNARNVAFLLGSGTSSYEKEGMQVGIPTMQPLAKAFTGKVGKGRERLYANATERNILADSLGLDIQAAEYVGNLERLMEVLYSHRFALSKSKHQRHVRARIAVESVITKIQRFLLDRCTVGAFSAGDETVLKLYQSFYRKLVFRDRSLPRPWVFTTNYDLFNETAMDRLGLPYCNGFSGTIERRFNPAVFRYALAEQIDIASRKWTAVDGFVYLCKLHGSVSWSEDGHGLFPIRENQTPPSNGAVMIYPTPAKQNSSLGSPYSDLFREFQSRIVREQSVLFTLGYNFGDEHINNIIYQALTIPTFRLVIFAAPDQDAEIGKLRDLKDPRIWLIGGDAPGGGKTHYFDTFVDKLMPAPPGDRIDTAVRKVVEELIRPAVRRDEETNE